jgi:hypothetical protein
MLKAQPVNSFSDGWMIIDRSMGKYVPASGQAVCSL